MMFHLAFKGHPRSVELVDLPLVHLLSLEGEQRPPLVLRGALGLSI